MQLVGLWQLPKPEDDRAVEILRTETFRRLKLFDLRPSGVDLNFSVAGVANRILVWELVFSSQLLRYRPDL